ncbi:hypothetical protein [Gracilibacillus alcaliphilus]|nr:hypothetical protein [Gracilibacillus alcaliphilus]MBM7675334.1 hypothetical protein [Gracilibacillus alcaliphilus]
MGREKEWTALESDDSGCGATILAPLFWLQGVEQVTPLGNSHYTIN